MMFVLAALLALNDVFGKALHFPGLDRLILFQAQYAYVASRIPEPKIIDFQLLEMVALFSIAILGARVLIWIIYLRQYDGYFGEFSSTQSGKLYAVLPFAALGLYATIDVQLHFGIRGISEDGEKSIISAMDRRSSAEMQSGPDEFRGHFAKILGQQQNT